MVILAAGEGSRLRPFTTDRPKALVEVAGKPLLDWQVESAARLGVKTVAVVTGHMAERFDRDRYKSPTFVWYDNPRYAETNMVETLWCAEAEFYSQTRGGAGENREVIVSYGDILYQDSVLENLMDSQAAISVVVDLGWRSYWEARFDDPLSDAESLRLEVAGRITEIGQKANDIEEIQGQYIGLMKFKGPGIDLLRKTYLQTREQGGAFRKMYMTDLLQAMVDSGHEVTSVPIHRGWLEIDTLSDYELANRLALPKAEGVGISA